MMVIANKLISFQVPIPPLIKKKLLEKVKIIGKCLKYLKLQNCVVDEEILKQITILKFFKQF